MLQNGYPLSATITASRVLRLVTACAPRPIAGGHPQPRGSGLTRAGRR